MKDNEIIIYRGKGKKDTFNNIDSISVRGNKVLLEGYSILEEVKVPKRFSILLNGKVGNLIVPSEEIKRSRIKRLIAGPRVYNMEINGVLPKLSLKESNIKIGVSLENNLELSKNYINKDSNDKNLFAKFFINATDIYESLAKNLSKETKLGEVEKKVKEILHFVKEAEKTFTSFNFAPYLNSIIWSLNSILSKCISTPDKKVSSIWLDNLKIRHYISKILNSMYFRNILSASTV